MLRRILNRVSDEIINFVLPNSCLCCESPIAPGERFICRNCFQKLEKFDQPHPWKDEFIGKGIIDNSLSAFWFREGTAIQTLLHSMKYEKMKSVGRMLGSQIGSSIAELNGIAFDYTVPVPLHKARIRDRQYNQSEFIARGVSEVLNTIVLNDVLVRTRYTQTQIKLNKAERKENVKGAFEVNQKHKDKITDKNIIVVDDVITTGATILECAEVLKQAGAGKIWVCSAAYAALD
jgi:ComF family protein